MKPLKLSLCGIKSFFEPAEIDFEALSQGGIFGVFGNTGAGKSTVIDAMLFALYGETGDVVLADLVNRRSDRASVTFVFSAEDAQGKRRVYSIERRVRIRCGRSAGNTHTAELIETTDGAALPIASGPDDVAAAVTNLLRLDKDDFQNCVILRQGKYDKFVRAAPSRRKQTVVALFGLQRYGAQLTERVRARRNDVEKRLAAIDGALNAVGDVTRECVAACEAEEAAASAAADARRKAAEELRAAVDRDEKAALAYERFAACERDAAAAREADRLAKQALAGAEAALRQTDERCGQTLRRATEIETESRARAMQLRSALGLDARIAAAEAEVREATQKKQAAETAVAAAETELAQAEARIAAEHRSFGAAIAYVRETFGLELPETDDASGKLSAFADHLAGDAERLEQASAELRAARTECENREREKRTIDETVRRLRDAAAEAQRRADEARAALEAARVGSAVDEVAHSLRIGDVCPVCGNIVSHLPEHPHGDLAKAKAAADAAEGALKQADGAFREAERAETAALERLEHAQKTLASATAARAACNDGATRERVRLAERCRDRVAQILDAERKASLAQTDARRKLAESRGAVGIAEQALVSAAKARDEARAELERLLPDGGTVTAALAAATARAERAHAEQTEATAELARATDGANNACAAAATAAGRLHAAEEALAACTVRAFDAEAFERKKAELREALALDAAARDALVRAQEATARRKAEYEKAKELLQQKKTASDELVLVKKLEGLVEKDKFAEWIAEEYVKDFTAAASERLRNFTGGEMGLVYGSDGFAIEDYLNGGALRRLATVSGGETFLVSLAVAIAIAEKLGERAGASRAEFMFIDEGFGTLSPDKLDAVMDALTGLARENVTIGFISHVSELETRIPCRLMLDRSDPERGSICTVEGV